MSKNITQDPNVLSGTPVIAGTRIPVKRIIFLLSSGYTLDSIHSEYPQVSVEKLNAVMEEVAQGYDSQMA